MLQFPVILVALAFSLTSVFPAESYLPNKGLAERLQALAGANPNLIRLTNVATTLAKNDVWAVEVGAGAPAERQTRPALLLVAGIEGNDLAGSAVALTWIESLATKYKSDKKIQELLETSTVYIFPRLNPDASDFFVKKPRMETAVNLTPVDDDHDGAMDEDGPEDLDEDGLITSMRVEDPDGEYIPDSLEPRLMVRADPKKHEKGAWRILSEGIDNDKDEAWNEDGPGGVNLNRNFPYNYKYFAPWAGLHQVSEVETRGLADFAVAHPNVGIVFTFGAADNLVQTPKGEAPKRPPVAIHEEDIGIYRDLGKAWRDALGLKKELTGAAEPGTFSDWMYFHRGRLSLAARPWSPALQLELSRPAKEEPAKEEKPKEEPVVKEGAEASQPAKTNASPRRARTAPEKKVDDAEHNKEERAFLKWADENASELFVPWKTFQHPDFPGKKVEIGGWAPFAKTNPPEKLLPEFARKEQQFLTELLGKLPRIGIRKLETKTLGNGLYELTLQVENTGELPTALAQGTLTREVYATRVTLNLEPKFILSGERRTSVGALAGNGGRRELRYVIQASQQQKVEIEVVSMLGGTVRRTVELGAK